MQTFTTTDRAEWRAWLSENFESAEEIWFLFPLKESGRESLSYNDAVEEALCFGWIDSINKYYDRDHRARRFTPRRKGSPYSRQNIERLIMMDRQGLIHPSVREKVLPVIEAPFEYPQDIMEKIKQDPVVYENYGKFPEVYRRIRVSHIDGARNRPEEFERRLNNFIEKTRAGKLISGYGGIDKYYREQE